MNAPTEKLCCTCALPLKKRFLTLTVGRGATPTLYRNHPPGHPWHGKPILKIKGRRPALIPEDRLRGLENIDVWIGGHKGYANNLFCSKSCCIKFAESAFKAGYRIRR